MPIVKDDDGVRVEYSIPEEIDQRIPEYFYTALAGELFGIFGWERSKSMFYPDEDRGYVDLASSSAGWYQAFKVTCKKLKMEWLLEYYDSLPWYDSDAFDGEIEERIGKCFMVESEDGATDYYRYLIKQSDDGGEGDDEHNDGAGISGNPFNRECKS